MGACMDIDGGSVSVCNLVPLGFNLFSSVMGGVLPGYESDFRGDLMGLFGKRYEGGCDT